MPVDARLAVFGIGLLSFMHDIDIVALGHQDKAHRRTAADVLHECHESVRDAWLALLTERSQFGAIVPVELLTAFLEGLTGFIDEPDHAFPAGLAARWRDTMVLSPEGLGTTAVALGLIGESLRSGLSSLEPETYEAVYGIASAALPAFTGEFVRSLMTISDVQPSEAYWYEVSRRLTEDRERRVTQLAILNEVSAALSTTLSIEELYEIIYRQCGRLVDTTNFYIATIEPNLSEMTMALHYFGGARRRDLEGGPVRMGLTRSVIERGAPLMVDDYLAACRELGITPMPEIDQSRTYAWMGAPIISGDQPIGIIATMSDRGPFDLDDLSIMAAVARQAGAAIANGRLYQAQIVQANRLKAINHLARAFASLREPRALMDEAAALIRRFFGYSAVSIFVASPVDIDDDRLILRAQAGIDQGEELLGLTLRSGVQGIVGHAAARREPVLVNDVAADPHYVDSPQTQHIRSEVAVPLLRDDQLLGVLDIESPDLGAFSPEDVEVLTTVADQLAVALENADLFRQERKRRTELALILEAARAANSSLVLDDVIQRVAEGVADAVGLPSCVVYLYDESEERLLPSAFVAREGSRLDTTLVSQVAPTAGTSQLLRSICMTSKEPCALEMMTCDVNDELARVLCASAVLAVPFIVKEHLLGFALVVSHDAEYHFSEHQLRVAYGIAGAAALALENARLYARSHSLGMAEERIRVAREIHDGIAQGLTAVSLHLEAADQMLAKKPEKAHAKLRRALELTRDNLENARRSVLDLRASALQELTLAEAMQHRVQQFLDEQQDAGAPVTATVTGDPMCCRISSRLELSLYRIFEEALDNIARHAGATHVDVTLSRQGADVVLRISDNGAGFDVDSVMASRPSGSSSSSTRRFGLVAIRERVRLLRGNLEVESRDGQGTRLLVTVPYESQMVAATSEPEAESTANGSTANRRRVTTNNGTELERLERSEPALASLRPSLYEGGAS